MSDQEVIDSFLVIMNTLVAIDVAYLHTHTDAPTLASVRETIEMVVEEEMRDVGAIVTSRQATSSSLAAWRCAELVVAGREPMISVKGHALTSGGSYLAVGVALDGVVEWY